LQEDEKGAEYPLHQTDKTAIAWCFWEVFSKMTQNKRIIIVLECSHFRQMEINNNGHNLAVLEAGRASIFCVTIRE